MGWRKLCIVCSSSRPPRCCVCRDHDEVVELTDDLGLNATDIPAIKAKLRKQGVTGFVDVKLYE